jgi:hypothetical protein
MIKPVTCAWQGAIAREKQRNDSRFLTDLEADSLVWHIDFDLDPLPTDRCDVLLTP